MARFEPVICWVWFAKDSKARTAVTKLNLFQESGKVEAFEAVHVRVRPEGQRQEEGVD